MVIAFIPTLDQEKQFSDQQRQVATLEHLKNVRAAAKQLSLKRVREFQKEKKIKLQTLSTQEQKKDHEDAILQKKLSLELENKRMGEAQRLATVLRRHERHQFKEKLESIIFLEQQTKERGSKALKLERLARTLKSETDIDALRQQCVLKESQKTKLTGRSYPSLPDMATLCSNLPKPFEKYEHTRFHTVRNRHSHRSAMHQAESYTLEQAHHAEKQLQVSLEQAQRVQERGARAILTVRMEKNKDAFLKALHWVHSKDRAQRKSRLHLNKENASVFPEPELKNQFEIEVLGAPRSKLFSSPSSSLGPLQPSVQSKQLKTIPKQIKQSTKPSKSPMHFTKKKSHSHATNVSSTLPGSSQTKPAPKKPSTNPMKSNSNEPSQNTWTVGSSSSDLNLSDPTSVKHRDKDPLPRCISSTSSPTSSVNSREANVASLSSPSVSMFTDLSAPSVHLSHLTASFSSNVSRSPSISTMQTSTLDQALSHVDSVVDEIKSEFDACLSFLK